MRRNWQDAPTITIPVYVPCCQCGGDEFIAWGGSQNGDDSSTQQVICKRCSRHFKIVRERFPVRESVDTDCA